MQCKAEVVADSLNPYSRITTFLLEYPRIVHTHLLTHRMFSRNSSSSRAIPTSTVLTYLREHTAEPVFWGANQQGMQSYTELSPLKKRASKAVWYALATINSFGSYLLSALGVHKQISNRPTEPYTYIKVLVTATEFDNWFDLRLHHAADPTVRQLAEVMKKAYDASTPQTLENGQWHSPFSNDLKVSVSCAAQTSYRKHDESYSKAVAIFQKLNLDSSSTEPAHSSPTEHQAQYVENMNFDTKGVTHLDKNGFYWSGNLRGWVQYRHVLEQTK
jgi:hypothetical protein